MELLSWILQKISADGKFPPVFSCCGRPLIPFLCCSWGAPDLTNFGDDIEEEGEEIPGGDMDPGYPGPSADPARLAWGADPTFWVTQETDPLLRLAWEAIAVSEGWVVDPRQAGRLLWFASPKRSLQTGEPPSEPA